MIYLHNVKQTFKDFFSEIMKLKSLLRDTVSNVHRTFIQLHSFHRNGLIRIKQNLHFLQIKQFPGEMNDVEM